MDPLEGLPYAGAVLGVNEVEASRAQYLLGGVAELGHCRVGVENRAVECVHDRDVRGAFEQGPEELLSLSES